MILGSTHIATRSRGLVPVDEVIIGDVVECGFGAIAQVVGIVSEELGSQTLIQVNGDLMATTDTLFYMNHGKWGAVDPQLFHMKQPKKRHVKNKKSGPKKTKTRPGKDQLSFVAMGADIGFGLGVKRVDRLWDVTDEFPADTMLYELVVEKPSTVMVGSGYVIEAWADENEFDFGRFGTVRKTGD